MVRLCRRWNGTGRIVLSILLFFFTLKLLHAATVTGSVVNAASNPLATNVLFIPWSTPQVSGNQLVASPQTNVLCNSLGAFSIQLKGGDYRVNIGNLQRDTFFISVPTNEATYNMVGLITNNLTYSAGPQANPNYVLKNGDTMQGSLNWNGWVLGNDGGTFVLSTNGLAVILVDGTNVSFVGNLGAKNLPFAITPNTVVAANTAGTLRVNKALQSSRGITVNSDNSTIGISTLNDVAPLFLRSGFASDAEPTLRMASSRDGIRWHCLDTNCSTLYTGIVTAGFGNDLIRDPSIVAYSNSLYCAYTANVLDNFDYFSIAKSDDGGLSWNFLVNVTNTTTHGANCIWAPEWFLDGSFVRIYWSRGDGGQQTGIFETHALNGTLTSWSPAAPVLTNDVGAGNGPYIDPTMIKVGSTYFLFFRDLCLSEGNCDYISRASSTSPTNGFMIDRSGDWAGWGQQLEGPNIVALGTNRWRIYIENFIQTKYYYAECGEPSLSTWTPLTEMEEQFRLRHGTVYPLWGTNVPQRALPYADSLVGTRTECYIGYGLDTNITVAVSNAGLAAVNGIYRTNLLNGYTQSVYKIAWSDTFGGYVISNQTVSLYGFDDFGADNIGDGLFWNSDLGGGAPLPRSWWGPITNCFTYLTSPLGLALPNLTTNLYVEITGNDTNAVRGRPDRPWRNLQVALLAVSPGDTVRVGAGNFPELPFYGESFWVSNNVKVVGSGRRVTIIGTEGGGQQAMQIGSGVVLQGFTLFGLVNVGGTGVIATNSLVNDLEIIGDSDAIYVADFEGTFTAKDSRLVSQYDGIGDWCVRPGGSNRVIRLMVCDVLVTNFTFTTLHGLEGGDNRYEMIGGSLEVLNGAADNHCVRLDVATFRTNKTGSVLLSNVRLRHSSTNGLSLMVSNWYNLPVFMDNCTEEIVPGALVNGSFTNQWWHRNIAFPNGSIRTNRLVDTRSLTNAKVDASEQAFTVRITDDLRTASGTNIYIYPSAGQTINGAAFTNITTDGGSIVLQIRSNNWQVISPDQPSYFERWLANSVVSYTNLNGAATLTNLGNVIVPAHSLTNQTRQVQSYWSGVTPIDSTPNTNQWRIRWGSDIALDTGLQTFSNGMFRAGITILRNNGNTSQKAEAWFTWTGGGAPFAMTNKTIVLSQTNGIDTLLTLEGAARRVGAHTNDVFWAKLLGVN